MHLKVLHKWTNNSFDSLLKLLKKAFLKDNKLSMSHYDAKKWMAKQGLGYESIHICKYNCTILWKEHVQKENSSVCGESHWVDKNMKDKSASQSVVVFFQ